MASSEGCPKATATLPTRTKNRKQATLPIPEEVASQLRESVRSLPQLEPIWKGTWSERTSDLLRHDLTAAGIPSVTDGPDGKRVVDAHSLRHSYIAMVHQTRLTEHQTMELSRHSDPRLTFGTYGKSLPAELRQAVERMPKLVGMKLETPSEMSSACTPLVPAVDPDRDLERLDETIERLNEYGGSGRKPLDHKEFATKCDEVSQLEITPRVGFEPTTGRLTVGCSTAELSRKR
jgi:hypothetical protein